MLYDLISNDNSLVSGISSIKMFYCCLFTAFGLNSWKLISTDGVIKDMLQLENIITTPQESDQ